MERIGKVDEVLLQTEHYITAFGQSYNGHIIIDHAKAIYIFCTRLIPTYLGAQNKLPY